MLCHFWNDRDEALNSTHIIWN